MAVSEARVGQGLCYPGHVAGVTLASREHTRSGVSSSASELEAVGSPLGALSQRMWPGVGKTTGSGDDLAQ